MITSKKNGLSKIWLLFLVFFLMFLFNFGIKTNIGHTSMMWLLLDVYVFILAIFMLIKNKLPEKKHIIMSVVFSGLMFISAQGISFSSIITFIVTLLSSLATFSVFKNYMNNSIKIFKSITTKSIFFSISIGLLFGTILGIINLFLSSGQRNFHATLSCFLTSINPAIYEEMAFRAFLFAVCLYFLKGEIRTRKEQFACYFLMIIPHVMIHTPDMFVRNGVISGIIGILLLTAIFGLPLAILQRKRDLSSAMITHGIIDFIRFCVFGLPY